MIARGGGARSSCVWAWWWSSTSNFNQWFQGQGPCSYIVWAGGLRTRHSGEWTVGNCGDIVSTEAVRAGVIIKHTEGGSRFIAGTSGG